MANIDISDDELNPRKLPKLAPEDEIVISGVAGRFPESNNMQELHDNLMNKVDMVTDDDRRWNLVHPDIPKRTGKINNLEKFDALFFGVHSKQARTMDPMCRMLLEHAYEAVVDAGVNPRQLRGTRTGVFIGTSFSETEKTWFYDKLQVNGFGISGCARAMYSNRISYFLGVTGPSYAIDTACSSSLYAMEHAYRAMREGLCDAAIVGGSNLCLHPFVSMQFYKMGVTSPDGRSKSFDESANGYVRSESIPVIFLQKRKDAKRIYATVVHGKINCDGFKEEGVTFPSTHMQSVLMKEFYMECGLSPTIVNYIEAHGTGTRVGDPEEVNAIDRVFAPKLEKPLKIGSVKSNLGHSEPASGLCSVAKVIIAMETGIIPPNLHYNTPREGISSLKEGRIKVITEPTPWENDYAGVNSFGFGGANAHILLKSNPKKKVKNGEPRDDFPRLVAVSGRTENAVLTIINYLNSRPVDVEYVALLHSIHSDVINGHLYRGYTILPPRGIAKQPIQEVQSFAGTKRPVWFVFAGMGSQWPGMGEALLRIPIFAEAIKKCDAILKPLGLDIHRIITNKDKSAFDNILNSFVGIAAVQIGLVDILRSLGIVPDKLIGHSVGELGCAYVDDCSTAEQMLLSAYSRGLASIETKIIPGAMAAVGLGYKDIKNLCPPDIEVACHNSADSSTISGPAESMRTFIAELQAKNIFAKEVSCSNIPYHSRYVYPSGAKLLSYMQKIVPEPKLRSSKWLSTSVPMDKWDTPAARYSSAEYHTNNVLNPVLFEEACALVPKDAITIEIAPHGLLQAILRRSLAPTVTNIALTQRGHPDNVEVLLRAIGKMFTVGLQPQLANLYPPVEFPVSRTTPMISPLIKWEHSDDWFVTSYSSQHKIASSERNVKISITDSDYETVAGHVVDGRNLFPATGYLTLVWETIGMMRDELFTEISVVFEQVKFLRATTIPKEGSVDFMIMIHKGTGQFEIAEGGTAVVTGIVRATSNPAAEKINASIQVNENEEESMTSRDVYKELRLRGYNYAGIYRSIKRATVTASKGHIVWQNDWIAFMDNMLQMMILSVDTRGLFVPTSIKKIVIDVKAHQSEMKMGEIDKEFPVYVDKIYDVVVCGGVEMRGMKSSAIGRRKPAGDPVLEEYKFVPHLDRAEVNLVEIARLSTHIVIENHLDLKVKTIELTDVSNSENLLSPFVLETLGDLPLIQADVSIVSTKTKFKNDTLPSNLSIIDPKKIGPDTNAVLAIGYRLLYKDNANHLNLLLSSLKDNGFLLTRESIGEMNNIQKIIQDKDLDIILEKKINNEFYILLKKRNKTEFQTKVVFVNNDSFTWVEDMRKIMSEESEKKANKSSRVLFVGQGDFENGLMGFVNCLRKEPGGESVRGLLIQDSKAPKFSLQEPSYAKLLQKDLVINVIRENGKWGSYRHLPLPPLKPKPVKHAFMNQLTRGDVSSLSLIEGPLKFDLKNKNLVNIVYSSINFKDVMLVTGKLALESIVAERMLQQCGIGLEFCGFDRNGKRIMGLVESRAISNLIEIDPDMSWEIPDKWTFEDAATVPCVYATSYYALYTNGHMKKGDKVLIHAGTGGIGQSAINLALNEGCEVFTTVGTPEKRMFIREHFPQIPDDHIGNSRDTSFQQMIMKQTNGRGVDIVLNSLAEEKLLESVECLARKGRFLEIGKFDLVANNQLGLQAFLREISFHGVMLDLILRASKEEKMHLQKMMSEGLKNGAIKPLVRTVFTKDHVEEAFRYMGAGKHIGKVILKMTDEKKPLDTPILALPQYYCQEGRSYLILGGLGGFGLELADWLILRGAKNVVFTSRNGISNGYQKMRINIWQSYGVKIVVIAGKDVSKYEDCHHIIKTTSQVAPIDGIFNLAAVLNDAYWNNQTLEFFEESFRGKAWATKNLDIITRKLCPTLRHFVVFSSAACGRGNPGQTNYGMANSVMERICEKRASEGLPALAIQWGAIGDVGLVAEMQEDHKELVIGGTLQQRITSCLQKLDEFLTQNHTIVSSMVVAEKRAGGGGALNMVDTVLNIMGLKDLKGISPTTSLAELGMDSMMGVEIKQTLEREFEVFLTAQDIRNLTFAKLDEMSTGLDDENPDKNESRSVIESDLEGMKLFVQLIGVKEANEAYVKLPTKEDYGKNEVFLIPGLEGTSSVFTKLAPKIKPPAVCLQLNPDDANRKTIFSMAEQLLPHLLKRNKNNSLVTLVGYSYGAVIAVELMRILERDYNSQGRLILIDGAPDHLKNLTQQQLPYKDENELQNLVLLGFINIVHPSMFAQLKANLQKCKTWKDKVQAFIALSQTSSFDLPEQYQHKLSRAIYERLLAVKNYEISNLPPIKAPITLLKPTAASLNLDSEDYNLSKVTSGKVDIYYVEGNHVTIVENDKVANAINGEDL